MLPPVNAEMRVGTDPELRFTPAGMPICSFRAVASSRKEEPKGSGNWVDDRTAWVTVTTFQQTAENVVESIQKGDLVVVLGRLEVQEWTDNENNKRISVNVVADTIGPSLRWSTAKVSQAPRTNGGGPPQQQQSQQWQRPPQQQSGGDPWATPPPQTQQQPQQQQGSWRPPGQSDEPPY